MSFFQDDMHVDDAIKTVKVPFGRRRKKGRQLCDPYTPPPPTTPIRSKRRRTSSRRSKSIVQPSNDINLEPWIEVHRHFEIFLLIVNLFLLMQFSVTNHHLNIKMFHSN